MPFLGSCLKISPVIRANIGDFFGSVFVLISLIISLGFVGDIWLIFVFYSSSGVNQVFLFVCSEGPFQIFSKYVLFLFIVVGHSSRGLFLTTSS